MEVVKSTKEEVVTDTRKITLKSLDHQEFEISTKAAGMVEIIQDMIEMHGDDVYNEKIEVQVNSGPLKKVIEYIEYHKDLGKDHTLKKPEEKESDKSKIDKRHRILPTDDILEWDIQFFSKVSHEELFRVTQAAFYLIIPPLCELCAKNIAGCFNGKTAQYIAETFKTKDLTSDEQETIRRANSFRDEDHIEKPIVNENKNQ